MLLQSVLRPSPLGLSASLCRSFLSSSHPATTTTTAAIPLRISRILASSSAISPFRTHNAYYSNSSISSSSSSPATTNAPPHARRFNLITTTPFKRTALHQPQNTATPKCLFSTTSAAMEGEGRMYPPDRRWSTPRPTERKTASSKKELIIKQEAERKELERWQNRKPPQWVQYYQEKARLSDHEEPPEMSNKARLLPAFIFTVCVWIASALYAINYKPPQQKDRFYPEIPMALATVVGIMSVNFIALLAWRVPPLWRTMNRFFMVVPAMPSAPSMLGAAVSHHRVMHLGVNMLVLFLWGPTLCEQIGRGNFLGMYCSAGVAASFFSLTSSVLAGALWRNALGASGAIFGLIGAFAYLNPDYPVRLLFLPFWEFTAAQLVTAVAVIEAVSFATSFMPNVDRVAHLSGLASGILFMYLIHKYTKRKQERMREELTNKSGRR